MNYPYIEVNEEGNDCANYRRIREGQIIRVILYFCSHDGGKEPQEYFSWMIAVYFTRWITSECGVLVALFIFRYVNVFLKKIRLYQMYHLIELHKGTKLCSFFW